MTATRPVGAVGGTRTQRLPEWFDLGLARTPGGVALQVADRTWAYAELDRLSRRCAAALHAIGVHPQQRVAVLAAKTETAYVGLLGALRAGATVVPLGTETPPDRMVTMAMAAVVDAVVVEERHAALAEHVCAATGAALHVPGDHIRLRAALAEELPPAPVVTAAPGDLAYILFTSGSTGVPKGVPISHHNVGAFLEASLPRFDVGPGDRFSQVYEPTFDLAMFDLFMAWASGAAVVAVSRLQALDPVRCVTSFGLTVWHTTPSLAAAVQTRGRLPPGSMPGLRHSVFCGEPLPERVAAAWQAAAPGTVLDNIYGPTELTIACTYHRRPADRPEGEGTVPIGVPNAGMEHRLLGEDGRPVAAVAGAVGELCMRGPQMFAGYLDPAQDEGRFAEIDGRRWYRTGDRVRVEEPHGLVHLGRTDSQVKIQGYRVELGEIEHAIERLTGADALVYAVPDGAATVLGAFVLGPADRVAPDEGLAAERVCRELAHRLPPYMVPAAVWFLPDPPCTTSSKVDRAALRREAGDRIAARRTAWEERTTRRTVT